MSATVSIDGGQSQIRMFVSGEDGIQATQGVSHLESNAIDSVVEAVRGLWGDRSDHVERLVAGLTTIPATEAEQQELAKRLREVIGAAEVWVCGDQVTSHAGAFAGETGIALSVGTGVACLAIDETDGTHRTFDGAGYLVGDEGGGFWLGQHGIRAALAAHEGRSASTSLTSRVAGELGPLDSAAVRIHGNSRAVDFIAQTAVVVLAEAEAGDPVASAIVSDAASRLVTTVSAALLFLSHRSDVTVAVDGRLLLNDSRLRDQFLLQMERAYPSVSVFETPGSSLDGAIWLSQCSTPGVYDDLITTYRTDQ